MSKIFPRHPLSNDELRDRRDEVLRKMATQNSKYFTMPENPYVSKKNESPYDRLLARIGSDLAQVCRISDARRRIKSLAICTNSDVLWLVKESPVHLKIVSHVGEMSGASWWTLECNTVELFRFNNYEESVPAMKLVDAWLYEELYVRGA